MRLRLAMLVSSLLFVSAHAYAGDINGVAGVSGKSAVKDVVVYLEGGASSHPLANAMVDQRHRMFMPHVSVVTQGTTVRFPNDDTIFHNVFAYFRAKKFDLGMYTRGTSKSVTFDKTGLVAIFCNIHSDMSAYVMVVDTPYYAVTDDQGRFQLTGVPPGHYTLKAWHESGATFEQPVTVGDSDLTLPISLSRK